LEAENQQMYACIDLGSNSFHLLIANWHDGRHDIVERFSDKVQLGEGLAEGRRLNDDAFARGLRCLHTFRHALDRYPIQHCWAVGTNALRIASNADEFLKAASQLGINIDIVSGLEEAALVYAGVNSALPESPEPRLIIDIGGGSTELVIGQGDTRLQSHSMPIGCISWRDRWFAEQPADTNELEKRLDLALQSAEQVFAEVTQALAANPWSDVYASSGTAKMLAGVCAQRMGSSSPNSVDLPLLKSFKPDILQVARDPTYVLPGLKNGRRELVLPGWAVLCGFMQATGVQSLRFSPSALREGMLHYMVKAAISGDSPLHELRAN